MTEAELDEWEKLATPRMGRLIAEVRRLRAVIERDRTASASIVAALRKEIGHYSWIADGRGPYEWDDDEYRREFGRAMGSIRAKLNALVQEAHAHDLSDCPTTQAEVDAARQEPMR